MSVGQAQRRRAEKQLEPAGAAAEVVEVLGVPVEWPAPPTTGNEFVYTTEADDDHPLLERCAAAADPYRLLLASCRLLLVLLLDDGGACCRTSRLITWLCFAVDCRRIGLGR